MHFEEFSRVVTCFADRVDDVATRGGELLVQIRDETITARLSDRPDGLVIEENGDRMPAERWIVTRLARVPLLADRILSYVTLPKPFVQTSGRLVDQPDRNASAEGTPVSDVSWTATRNLDGRPGGTTSVLYLTADAGEGKTTLIDYLAVKQAEAYKAKDTDWLLVPIPLGGRTFLRFDDVVVSSLVNRLRFQLLYYDAFLELVRLGVLVPAFDGFEEMIIEGSSGEAISALGNLLKQLRSAGSILVSARRALFDNPGFGARSRLFDTIAGDEDVAFAHLSLDRWNRQAFMQYSAARGVTDPSRLFEDVSCRLGQRHPVLTRAVLIRRLVDIAVEVDDISALLDRIGQDSGDYFHDFVACIVEREANRKWLDKSGEPPSPLLTAAEHHELLSLLAQEMWIGATDDLGMDVVALLVEMFASQKGKSPAVERQIGERIRQHALLDSTRPGRMAFDHEDFRVFYLGQALGRALVADDPGDVRVVLDKAALPGPTVAEACRFVRRSGQGPGKSLELLQTLANGELPASFVRENCGALTVALLDGANEPHEARNMTFPPNALCGRKLTGLTVSGSYFHATALSGTTFHRCRFVDCHFESIDLHAVGEVTESSLEPVHVESIVKEWGDDQVPLFDPDRIARELRGKGFHVGPAGPDSERPTDSLNGVDEDLRLTQRFVRLFLRATAVNEGTVRSHLGVKSNHFFKELLPRLTQAGVVEEIPYRGHGSQRRVRLGRTMARIEKAVAAADGVFDRFVENVTDQE